MIVYDGVSLNSVAKVDIEDVRVSPIAFDEVTRPRAIRGGSDFVRSRAGTRTVAITFALLDDNMVSRQKALLAISTWAKNDKEYKLELPGHPEHYLMAICTGKPEPSLRQWWESKLRLVFTCYDNPYWNSKSVREFSSNNSTETNIFINGDAPPLLTIRRTNAEAVATARSFSIDGVEITFSQLPAGTLVIDANNQTAYVGTTSVMQYYNMTSRFFDPHPGAQAIKGTGVFSYRERWQ